MIKSRHFFTLLLLLLFPILLFGCSYTAPPPPDMSWYKAPAQGTAGIYLYQWKVGILGSYSDVRFILDKQTLGKINTGEYLYFEVPAGKHKYRYKGGIIPQYAELDFIAGQNYFFRGVICLGSDLIVLIKDEDEINKTIKNIESGKYESGDKDSTMFFVPLEK